MSLRVAFTSSDDANAGLRHAIVAASRNGDVKRVLSMVGKWRQRDAPVEDGVYAAGLIACDHRDVPEPFQVKRGFGPRFALPRGG